MGKALLLFCEDKYSHYFEDRVVEVKLINEGENSQKIVINLSGKYAGQFMKTSEISDFRCWANGHILYVETSNGNSKWVFFSDGEAEEEWDTVSVASNDLGISAYSEAAIAFDAGGHILVSYADTITDIGSIKSAVIKEDYTFVLHCTKHLFGFRGI